MSTNECTTLDYRKFSSVVICYCCQGCHQYSHHRRTMLESELGRCQTKDTHSEKAWGSRGLKGIPTHSRQELCVCMGGWAIFRHSHFLWGDSQIYFWGGWGWSVPSGRGGGAQHSRKMRNRGGLIITTRHRAKWMWLMTRVNAVRRHVCVCVCKVGRTSCALWFNASPPAAQLHYGTTQEIIKYIKFREKKTPQEGNQHCVACRQTALLYMQEDSTGQ